MIYIRLMLMVIAFSELCLIRSRMMMTSIRLRVVIFLTKNQSMFDDFLTDDQKPFAHYVEKMSMDKT